TLSTSPEDIVETVGTALERARKMLARHNIEVEIVADLPMLELDPVLFEQALFHLLDNDAKYPAPATTVPLQAQQEENTVELRVLDEGAGIPPDEIDLIFDKFHRARKLDEV